MSAFVLDDLFITHKSLCSFSSLVKMSIPMNYDSLVLRISAERKVENIIPVVWSVFFFWENFTYTPRSIGAFAIIPLKFKNLQYRYLKSFPLLISPISY
jgi:hypothetical protein